MNEIITRMQVRMMWYHFSSFWANDVYRWKIYIFDVLYKYKYFTRSYIVMTIPCCGLVIYYENRVFRRKYYPCLIVEILVL